MARHENTKQLKTQSEGTRPTLKEREVGDQKRKTFRPVLSG